MINIRRSNVQPGELHKPEPLTWCMERDYTEKLIPVMVCSQGHESTLRTHSVANDGTVSPSSVCPVEGCAFHEYVRLDGWVPRSN